MDKVRIDKWLWAARFFKTRSLAKQAIEGGKVHADGQRLKPSKEITPGITLSIRQGWDLVEVEVLALSDQRRGADIARTLYRETEDSIARREQARAERQASNAGIRTERPNKKQRRQIHRFLREHD
ncbi:RNA-binding S4 domain-containing protein [Microbulbifer thermotolerans]|uniref:RNA-binding S4 domain-containing protein n=1 Tax=Microbulbifer thermotolerans TaxID=252514 RepID=UPI0008F1068E|nr:S4 domain-containing protein [Microbulbifer thermotolerans]MCX2780696.1 S4 domain-containing protein [Microbulbifer thermotolerans]MCX2795789.1 S4 domain-containing protein [Microbulbifer thermotolerans]MCX2806316.1 S4 domain-containing protein [Microbulbifer thermotolerans]MCX2832290.1 S4 domain-containing protein [Microbulbifer thermotolerans]SFC08989.1 ribosome-associated heat shock protein Hsp15 [Microbulbifer thermotolerans]